MIKGETLLKIGLCYGLRSDSMHGVVVSMSTHTHTPTHTSQKHRIGDLSGKHSAGLPNFQGDFLT